VRVLVTGGAGVLGQVVTRRLLAEDHEVVSVDIRQLPPTGALATVGDVRDRALVERLVDGADAVVHCAAALPSHRPEEIWATDVNGTEVLLELARRARVGRFVHISSTAVYGLPRDLPTPESNPREVVDPYNRAKIEAELLCERYRERGMCVPVLRPKTFLGPGRLGIFAMLFEWAVEGRNFPLLGGGHVRCQMLDVEDLCDVVMRTLTAPRSTVDDTFNVAATEFGTLRNDFQAVLDAAGHGGRVIQVPGRPVVAALRLLEVLRLSPVYKRLAKKLLHDSYVCTAKARDALNFAPRYSNTASILRTFDWYRENAKSLARRGVGRAHDEIWRQGALRLAKSLF